MASATISRALLRDLPPLPAGTAKQRIFDPASSPSSGSPA